MRSTALVAENIVVVAAMPRVSTSSAVAVNPRLCASMRMAKRMSWSMVLMPNAKCQMPNAKCQMPKAKGRRPNAEGQMPKAKCGMPKVKGSKVEGRRSKGRSSNAKCSQGHVRASRRFCVLFGTV